MVITVRWQRNWLDWWKNVTDLSFLYRHDAERRQTIGGLWIWSLSLLLAKDARRIFDEFTHQIDLSTWLQKAESCCLEGYFWNGWLDGNWGQECWLVNWQNIQTNNAMQCKYFHYGPLQNLRQVVNMTIYCRLAQQTELQKAPPTFIVGTPSYATRRRQLCCFVIQEVQIRLGYSSE